MITLGGDGTVLFAAKQFAYGYCPPIVSFGIESLGYLNAFEIHELDAVLPRIFLEKSPQDGPRPIVIQKERIMVSLEGNTEKEVLTSLNPKEK